MKKFYGNCGIEMSVMTILLLALSFANLGLRHDDESSEIEESVSPRSNFFGILALALVSAGQLLYLVLVAAWQQHWMKFYPGAPIQTYSLMAGMLLSVGAFFFASAGTGPKRLTGMIVAVTTAFLWLLSAVASAAV
jgi:hypothetical protein